MILVLTSRAEDNEICVRKQEGTLEEYMDNLALEYQDTYFEEGFLNWRNSYTDEDVDITPNEVFGMLAVSIQWWEDKLDDAHNELIIDIGDSPFGN